MHACSKFNWFQSNSCNEHWAAKASQVLTLGRDMTKSCSWAFWAASMTFSIVASFVLLPYLILSAMLQSNSTGSCDTIPIFDLRNCTFTFLESCPSINYEEMEENLKHHYKTAACNTQIGYSKINDLTISLKHKHNWFKVIELLLSDSFVHELYFVICLWSIPQNTLDHLLNRSPSELFNCLKLGTCFIVLLT